MNLVSNKSITIGGFAMKRKFLGISMLFMCLMVSACGTRKGDIKKDFEKINNASVNTDGDAIATKNNIVDKLEYTLIKPNGNEIKVKAAVDSKGCENPCVYKMVSKDINGTYMKKMADGFFGNDSYEFVKPYGAMSKDELEAELTFLNDIISSAENNQIYKLCEVGKKQAEYFLDNYTEKYDNQMHDYMFKLKKWDKKYSAYQGIEKLDDVYSNVAYFDCEIADSQYSRIRGKVDDEIWEIFYEDYNFEAGIENSNSNFINTVEKNFYIKNLRCKYTVRRELKLNDEKRNINDYEMGLATAQGVLDKIGYSNWDVLYATELELVNSNGTSNDGKNGYAFYFTPKIGSCNGMYFLGLRARNVKADNTASNYSCPQHCAVVKVTSDGLLDVEISGAFDTEGELLEKANVISFDKVDAIAKEKLMKVNDGSMTIDYIKFAYVCVSDDGKNFAMVPAWTYISGYDRGEMYPYLAINAIDGSVIDTSIGMHVNGYVYTLDINE